MTDAALLMTRAAPTTPSPLLGDAAGVRADLVRGRALIDLGRASEAVDVFQRVLDAAPEDLRALAYLELSRVLASTEKSGDILRGAPEAGPRVGVDLPALRPRRGRVLHEEVRGRPACPRVVPRRESRSRTAAHVRLAWLYRLAKRYDDAEKSLDAALAQAPEFLLARAELGRLHFARGKTKSAVSELKAVVETGTAAWPDELAYGEALLRQGDDGEALKAFIRARSKGAPNEELVRAVGGNACPSIAESSDVSPRG